MCKYKTSSEWLSRARELWMRAPETNLHWPSRNNQQFKELKCFNVAAWFSDNDFSFELQLKFETQFDLEEKLYMYMGFGICTRRLHLWMNLKILTLAWHPITKIYTVECFGKIPLPNNQSVINGQQRDERRNCFNASKTIWPRFCTLAEILLWEIQLDLD